MSSWFFENMKDFYRMGYRIEDILFHGKSDYQKVSVYQTLHHGKMLCNDDLVMVTEADEFIYHDMIVHVPLFVHPNPKSVLIIGGGDGGTAREVLRVPSPPPPALVKPHVLYHDRHLSRARPGSPPAGRVRPRDPASSRGTAAADQSFCA